MLGTTPAETPSRVRLATVTAEGGGAGEREKSHSHAFNHRDSFANAEWAKKCGRAGITLPHSKSHAGSGELKMPNSELELKVLLAKIESYWFALFAAFPDSLEPLVTGAAVGRFIPDQRHGFSGLDALSDIEEAIFFSILGNENFRDQLLRGVFDLEGIFVVRTQRDPRDKGDKQERASHEECLSDSSLKRHSCFEFWFDQPTDFILRAPPRNPKEPRPAAS